MSLPNALIGDTWTKRAARASLPLLVWCAKNGRTITYSQLDKEIVDRGWGHHVMVVQYGYPAGAIGNALIETEETWEHPIPPINALVINKNTQLPGHGIDWYLERYCNCTEKSFDINDKRAIVDEIHADIFTYEYWDELLEEYGLQPIDNEIECISDEIEISKPSRGGWSSESESEEHRKLKQFIANNPQIVGLDESSNKGITEYLFPSADKADIVFKNDSRYLGVEIKSIISNDEDINRGIFQCIKYQALLRAEQKASMNAPTARAILVVERNLPLALQNLADTLGIKIVVYTLNQNR